MTEKTEIVKAPAIPKVEVPPVPVKEKTKIALAKKKLPSDTVSVKVLTGSLSFEQGVFQKNEVFQTTRGRAAKFEASSAKIIE